MLTLTAVLWPQRWYANETGPLLMLLNFWRTLKSQKKASWIPCLLGFEIPLGQYLLTDKLLYCAAKVWKCFSKCCPNYETVTQNFEDRNVNLSF